MIYCVEPKIYPSGQQSKEEIKYSDENDFEWRISRVENGFFVRYYGDAYFADKIFCIYTKSDKLIKVKNTKCFFFQDADFDTFCEMREIIKTGWTDDIWESIESLLTARFDCDLGMIESEICNSK